MKMIPEEKTAHIVSRMQTDQAFRKEVCLRNHYWFFVAYFTRHIKYPCADMHKQMLYLSSMSWAKQMTVLGFPQCGKSLIHSYSLPLWSILNQKAKTVVIVVNGKTEKTQFRERFAKELMFNQKLLQDFELKYRKRGYFFFFPQYQAQICIVDLMTEADLDLVVGSSPDLIVIDAIQPYAESDQEAVGKQIRKIFQEAGTKDTRKIIVGRGDGRDGPLMSFTTEMLEKKDQRFFPAFYPFITHDTEEFAWPGKFKDEALVEIEFNRSITKEDFFFEYFILADVPEIPFRVTKECRNDDYPLVRKLWATKLNEEQKENISELIFVPYQGAREEAILLWGIKLTNETVILQGIEWQGEPTAYDITPLAIETREWLDTINPNARIGFYSDTGDVFSNLVARTRLDFRGQIIVNCPRCDAEYRQKLVEHYTATGTIQFHPQFADLILVETGAQKGFRDDWFNQLALVINRSAIGTTIFTTLK